MKAAVIGLGKSGISASHFLQKEGYSVFATDDKAISAPEGIHFLSKAELAAMLEGFEFVVISPGVPLSHQVAHRAKELEIPVFCDVELAFQKLAYKTIPLLGITGSNGKTTTTSLTCHILNNCSIPAQTAGNIGMPILSLIEKTTDAFVVELSSFQLETMQTKVLDAACILNLTPNHLDRHGTMEEYSRAKERIALCLKPEGTLWVNETSTTLLKACRFGFSNRCDLYTDDKYIYRFGKSEAELPKELQNSRSHNVENFLAAYALAREYGADPYACCQSYQSFIKPKHRLEYIGTHNDILFYDDSKATSIDAVLRAVESLQSPIVLIAGGVHKGYPYNVWQQAFKNKVRSCVLIGQAADIIEQDLHNVVPIIRAENLQDAVQKAMSIAKAQDAILLSPGCASYDMFTSFEERGCKFQEIFASLG